ncbi:MAG: glycohydrolase toxin TNT-related protein [Propionibacterium sp.]|nr:glycohydrolase toxin TNT-related protein [Propionibacterium sp.]
MPECVERLKCALNDVGVPVHDREDGLLIGGERNARTVMFWEDDGTWHVGHLDRVDQERVAVLTAADRDAALRWLICRVANQYRRAQGWPWLLSLRAAPEIAWGWGVEPVPEASASESADIRVWARPVRLEEEPVDVRMLTTLPTAAEVAVLSHLMDLSPDQILDAYLDPNGGVLEHLAETSDPLVDTEEAFQRMAAARELRMVPDEDGFHATETGWVSHLWIEDGCWCVGHTERGEQRSAEITSPELGVVLRWMAFRWLNDVRSSRGWPRIMTGYWAAATAPDWSQQQLGNRRILTGITGSGTEMILRGNRPRALDVLSHLMNLKLDQVVDSFLSEDGGLLCEVVDPGIRRRNPIALEYVAQYGDRLDQVGDPRGSYFCAVPGSEPYAFEQRSLPPSVVKEPYYRYRLLDLPPEVNVVTSIIPPWFGQPGGARQVFFRIGEILLTAEECIDLRILEGDA